MAWLSEYLTQLLRNPNYFTAETLKIEDPLRRAFCRLHRKSEKDLREYGLTLEWNNIAGLCPSNHEYRDGNGGTAVDLDSDAQSQRNVYMGDFHTHPYGLKYGEGIGVGPSNGDWVQWFQTPPRHKRIAVHCVSSGGELFVLIFRTLPPVGSMPDFNGITADAGRINNMSMNGRVEHWRGGCRSRGVAVAGRFRVLRRCLIPIHGSVSSARSSNRACGFPAPGSPPVLHAFAFGRLKSVAGGL